MIPVYVVEDFKVVIKSMCFFVGLCERKYSACRKCLTDTGLMIEI